MSHNITIRYGYILTWLLSPYVNCSYSTLVCVVVFCCCCFIFFYCPLLWITLLVNVSQIREIKLYLLKSNLAMRGVGGWKPRENTVIADWFSWGISSSLDSWSDLSSKTVVFMSAPLVIVSSNSDFPPKYDWISSSISYLWSLIVHLPVVCCCCWFSFYELSKL